MRKHQIVLAVLAVVIIAVQYQSVVNWVIDLLTGQSR